MYILQSIRLYWPIFRKLTQDHRVRHEEIPAHRSRIESIWSPRRLHAAMVASHSGYPVLYHPRIQRLRIFDRLQPAVLHVDLQPLSLAVSSFCEWLNKNQSNLFKFHVNVYFSEKIVLHSTDVGSPSHTLAFKLDVIKREIRGVGHLDGCCQYANDCAGMRTIDHCHFIIHTKLPTLPLLSLKWLLCAHRTHRSSSNIFCLREQNARILTE